MDIDTLKTELTDDPNGVGYAGMSDTEAAAALNAADITMQGPVPVEKLIRASAQHDLIYELQTGVDSGNKDKRKLCQAALAMINHPHITDLDVTDPMIAGMLAALVAYGIITAEAATAINAYGEQTVSRGTQIGLGHVKAGHVSEARR